MRTQKMSSITIAIAAMTARIVHGTVDGLFVVGCAGTGWLGADWGLLAVGADCGFVGLVDLVGVVDVDGLVGFGPPWGLAALAVDWGLVDLGAGWGLPDPAAGLDDGVWRPAVPSACRVPATAMPLAASL
jgi:hypothetical protein